MHHQGGADGLKALGALAAREDTERRAPRSHAGGGSSHPQALAKARPVTPQKWVQCNRCQKWRKVPFTLTDSDLSDNWECTGNLWDPRHASCAVPQELSDQEIDEILAMQVRLDADAKEQQHQQQVQQQQAPQEEDAYMEEAGDYEGDGYGEGEDAEDEGTGVDADTEEAHRHGSARGRPSAGSSADAAAAAVAAAAAAGMGRRLRGRRVWRGRGRRG